MSSNDVDSVNSMNDMYKYQRYIYDITRKYYLLGRDHLLDDLNPAVAETVLEIGCGTGRNLIMAARRYPHAKFYGFDISNKMLDTAHQSICRAGLSDKISLAQGDASQFDLHKLFGIAGVNRVFVSYALSMIPSWRKTLDASLAAVSSEGSLHVIDFGQQSSWPKIFRVMLFAWLGKFKVYPRSELKMELNIRAENIGFDFKYHQLYGGYADYVVLKHLG
ncbi:MAG TPA: 2-methoxy-6-polyprenyl-1,4-benzoquinol methylase, mitochondrial [Hyphomicrobiaceae bacterium MAG_BT-2024]